MFVGVYDGALSPAEAEVADSHAEDERQAEPHVVSHEYQHEDVGERRLEYVESRLRYVAG